MKFNNIEIKLDSFSLIDWVLVATVKAEILLQTGDETMKQRDWKAFCKEQDLVSKNISGKWFVKFRDDSDDNEIVDAETVESIPAVKPSVVTFGSFSNSLAVVNTGDIHISESTLSSGLLADEAGRFVSQLGAFTEFLNNTDRMLQERKADLERNTQLKRTALTETQLQVETIRQKVNIAQRESIGTQLENESIDSKMSQAVDLGKSLHSVLSSLD